MSKRAEQMALKAFPPKFASPKRYAKRVQSEKVDTHATIRRFYQKGYEQAEKDTIERAVAWLKDYVKYFELYDEKGVEEFKKAMEEE